MMSRSGHVNRLGSGEYADKQRQVAMGKVGPHLFEQLLSGLDEAWLDWAGRYTFPDPKGAIYTLTIVFEGDNWETGIAFTFGKESEGPPGDIWEFVDLAVDLTDEWYHSQKKPSNK